MSHAHLNSILAVGGAERIQPANPRTAPAPMVPTTRPAVARPTVKNSATVTAIKAFKWPSTTRFMISSTASGMALGKPKHCRTCSQRMRATVGVPIADVNGSGTRAVRMACVPRRMHSVMAESIFCSTSTTCAATAKRRTLSSAISSRVEFKSLRTPGVSSVSQWPRSASLLSP